MLLTNQFSKLFRLFGQVGQIQSLEAAAAAAAAIGHNRRAYSLQNFLAHFPKSFSFKGTKPHSVIRTCLNIYARKNRMFSFIIFSGTTSINMVHSSRASVCIRIHVVACCFCRKEYKWRGWWSSIRSIYERHRPEIITEKFSRSVNTTATKNHDLA